MSSTTPRRSPRNAIRPKVTAPAHMLLSTTVQKKIEWNANSI